MEVPVRTATFALLALAVVAGLLALGWIGGELHYRNCLQSIELRYPVAYQSGPEKNPWANANPHAHFTFYEKAERDRTLASCSRWP